MGGLVEEDFTNSMRSCMYDLSTPYVYQ
jgi:hypothetical protein